MLTSALRCRVAAPALIALLSAAVVGSVRVAAQSAPAPSLMNFQGRLAKPDGTPVPDGSYTIQFSVYNQLTAGTLLWQQNSANVPVHNGAFVAKLDYSVGYQNGATLSSLFGASAIYLTYSINGGAQLTPRQPFASVAYALKANSVADGSLTASSFAGGALNTSAWLLGGNSGTNPATQFLGTSDNLAFAFRTNNAERIRITSTGSVGVGTTAPLASFMSLTHDQWNPDYNGGWGDFVIGDGTRGLVFGVASAGGGAGAARIWTKGGTEYISLGGATNRDVLVVYGPNVGVGMLPNYKLDVAGTTNAVSGVTVGQLANGTYGVYGTSTGSYAIRGEVSGAAHTNGYFGMAGKDTVSGNLGLLGGPFSGVVGQNFVDQGKGVFGVTTVAGGYGVYGDANATTGYAVYGNGKSGGTTGWANVSDARYKTNISTLNNALESVLALRGVAYDWDKTKWPAMHFAEGRQIGFIAQEVEKIFPELVQTDANGYKSVMYANAVPALVEAIKAQQRQIDELKEKVKEIDELKAQVRENTEIKKQLAQLAAALKKMQDAQNR